MALSRTTKESLIETYSEGFVSSPNALVLGFRGLTVPQADDLRSKIRGVGGSYQVVKNSLALRAMKDSRMEELASHFDGPTAVAYSADDIVGLAKALKDFSKDVPVIEFRAGLVEGSLVAAEEIGQIADLPSREELLAKLLFLLQSPISRLARGLGAITQQFVSVLEQVRQQKDSA